MFPDNLMIKRIEADFIKCQDYNSERNEKILIKFRSDQTSLYNSRKSPSINKASLIKSNMSKSKGKIYTFGQINEQF